MEASPLTQQNLRPDVFEPKVVQLYREAFNVSFQAHQAHLYQ